VVDDAIVVVENVERWIAEGLAPRAAAIKAMEEVTGPVIGVALVLSAVFIPCAFIGGVTGLFFRQFALTIAISTILSAINSLTLSPALAAILLRPKTGSPDRLEWLLDRLFGPLFRGFNRFFEGVVACYGAAVAVLLRRAGWTLLVYGILILLTGMAVRAYPVGFVPLQDQGYLIVQAQLPDGATVQRTSEVMKQVDEVGKSIPGVATMLSISGQSVVYGANMPNFGTTFLVLDPFELRRSPEKAANVIMRTMRERCAAAIPDAIIGVYPAPPVKGLGVAGGFKFYIQDRRNHGPAALQDATDRFVADMQGWRLPFALSDYRADSPQMFLDIDRAKIRTLEIPIASVFETLQMYVGSLYVNNFNRFGRFWQVKIMADAAFRGGVKALQDLKVKTAGGQAVPLATVMTVRNDLGPALSMRFNLFPAAAVVGMPNPSQGGDVLIDKVDTAAARLLPDGFSYEWAEVFLLQMLAGNTAGILFVLGIALVFLVLAALYESWVQPLAVILVVPLCLVGAIVGLAIAKLPIDILAQVGLVVLVGLASKNAILIVEFASELVMHGQDIRTATLTSCRLRLRPILMTSLAFILGVFPLVVAQGAGKELRWSLGVAVFGGMIGVTIFGIFLTPVFFAVLQRFAARLRRHG
jgi:multidrug efflux pump